MAGPIGKEALDMPGVGQPEVEPADGEIYPVATELDGTAPRSKPFLYPPPCTISEM
jgi:hypothetical protein